MRTEGGTLENQTGATIESSSSKAVGMSQKAGEILKMREQFL